MLLDILKYLLYNPNVRSLILIMLSPINFEIILNPIQAQIYKSIRLATCPSMGYSYFRNIIISYYWY